MIRSEIASTVRASASLKKVSATELSGAVAASCTVIPESSLCSRATLRALQAASDQRVRGAVLRSREGL
jgi:hypothetical protein